MVELLSALAFYFSVAGVGSWLIFRFSSRKVKPGPKREKDRH